MTTTEVQAAAEDRTPTASFNVLGLVALLVVIVGVILAILPPPVQIVGWLLLAAGLGLAIGSLFLRGKTKTISIVALVAALVGVVVAVMAFVLTFTASLNDVLVDEPAADAPVAAASTAGTREDPHQLGTTTRNGSWDVTVNSVTLDATESVVAADARNQPPAADSEYILVNVTFTYMGDDELGSMPALVTLKFESPTGKTSTTAGTLAVAPDPLDVGATLNTGETATGNIVLTVPSADVERGLLIVGDTAFYSAR